MNHPETLEPSLLAQLENHFSVLNQTILRTNAKLVCHLSSDVVVVNIDSPNGKSLGYAEHPTTLQALLHANESIRTKKGKHWEYPKNQTFQTTWLDTILHSCGKLTAQKGTDGLVDTFIMRYVSLHEEIPFELRHKAYEEGSALWETMGYTVKVTPWPQLRTRQQYPATLDVVSMDPHRKPRKHGVEFFKIGFFGKGKTLLTSLVEITRATPYELNDVGYEYEVLYADVPEVRNNPLPLIKPEKF